METRKEFQEFVEFSESHVESTTVVYEIQESFTTSSYSTRSVSYNTNNSISYSTLNEDVSTSYSTLTTPVTSTEVVYKFTTENAPPVPPLPLAFRDVKLIEDNSTSIVVESTTTPVVETHEVYTLTTETMSPPVVTPPQISKRDVKLIEDGRMSHGSCTSPSMSTEGVYTFTTDIATAPPVSHSTRSVSYNTNNSISYTTLNEDASMSCSTFAAPEVVYKLTTEDAPPVPPLPLAYHDVKLIEDKSSSVVVESVTAPVVETYEVYTLTTEMASPPVVPPLRIPKRDVKPIEQRRMSFNSCTTPAVSTEDVYTFTTDIDNAPPVPPVPFAYRQSIFFSGANGGYVSNSMEDTREYNYADNKGEYVSEAIGVHGIYGTDGTTGCTLCTSRCAVCKPEVDSPISPSRETYMIGGTRTSFSTTTTVPVTSVEFIHKLPTQDIPPVPPLALPYRNVKAITDGEPEVNDSSKNPELFASIVEVPLDEVEKDQPSRQQSQLPSQQPSRQPSRPASTLPPPRRCNGNCRPERVDQASQLFSLAGGRSSFNPVFRILLITFLIVLANLGMAALLYFYLRAFRIEWNAIQIISAVPQGTVLLLTSLSVKVFIICIPFLMAMMALYVASVWMMNKQNITQVERLSCGCVVTDSNTPVTAVIAGEQYGLLLGLFKGATIFALWGAIKYIMFPSSSSSGRRGRLSKPLVQTFSVLFIALILLYSLLSVDLALHHLSSTKSVPIKSLSLPIPAAASSDPKLYSRSLKEECTQRDADGNACTVRNSAVTAAAAVANGNNAQTADFREGLKLLIGISSTDSIVFVPSGDQKIALLTSPESTYTSGDGFTARTAGIRTTCSIISPNCDTSTTCTAAHHPPTTHTTTDFTTGPCSAFSCSASGWPTYWNGGMTNSSGFFVSEPLELRGEDSVYSLQTPPTNQATDLSNFRFFASLSSFVDNSTLSTECVSTSSTTGLCSKGKDEGYIYGGDIAVQRVPNYRQLVTGCKVEVLDVEFEYFDGTYTLVKDSAKAADNSTSLALSSVLYTRDARMNALGVALSTLASSGSSSTDVVRELEEGVGRIMLAMGHTAFEPSSVLSLIWSVHVPATILPTAAIALFIVILVLFAVLAIVLGILAIIGINKGLWEEKRRVDAALKRANQTTPPPPPPAQPPQSYLRTSSRPTPDSCPPGLPVPRALSPLGSSMREKEDAGHCA